MSETTALGTTVFFAGCDPASGRGLYKTDGTTVTLVRDFLVYLDGTPVLAPANSCDPTNGPNQLTAINGALYFEVDDGDHGRELWKSDGTTVGTVMVADINGGVEPSDLLLNADSCGRASCRAVTAGGFFFTARDDWEGRELWFSDGSSATRLTAVEAGSNDGVTSPRILLSSNKLYFTGNDEDFNREPWVLPLTPTLSIADVSVSEGSPQATVTVRLLPANPLAPVTVNWATVNGSAGSPGDFTASLGTLTFPPNSTTQTLSVPIQNDATSESDESFSVRLSAEAGAQVVNRQNEVTIHDDDGLQLSVSGPLVDPNEGSSATFTISLTAPHDTFVSVYYHTVAGTAGAADFTSTVGWVQFDPTTSTTPQTKTVSVSTTADTMFEDDWETLELEIFEPSGASIANSRATAWIWDNDVEPTAQIGDKTVAEDNTFATFAVSLTRPSWRTVRLFWSADGGGANPAKPGAYLLDDDYRDAVGFFVFRPGETTHDVTLEVFDDIVDEPNEKSWVDLDTSNAVTSVVVMAAASARSRTTTPGRSPSATSRWSKATRTRRSHADAHHLERPYYQDFTVDYTTEDGTALAGNSDYTPSPGTLLFPKGTTSQTLTVTRSET